MKILPQKTVAPLVELEVTPLTGNVFNRDGKRWEASLLVQFVKEKQLEAYDTPLASLDLSVWPWDIYNIKGFCEHMNRCKAAGDYPIILDEFGSVCDGWHRIVAAIVEGKRTISVVRLPYMPIHSGLAEPVSDTQ
jgi:hypothetical protein